MSEAFAWMTGDAANEDELADAEALRMWVLAGSRMEDTSYRDARRTTQGTLHLWGAHKGDLYISGPRVDVEAVDGDYSAMYRAALDALLAQDERVRAGHAYSIGII